MRRRDDGTKRGRLEKDGGRWKSWTNDGLLVDLGEGRVGVEDPGVDEVDLGGKGEGKV